MTVELGYHTCALADLPAVLAALLKAEQFHAWLEDPSVQVDPNGLCLRDDIAYDEALRLPALWPEGRLFYPEVDLRWEHLPAGKIHLVAIGEPVPAPFRTPAPLVLTPLIRSASSTNDTCLLLWGERSAATNNVWSEGRIPDLKRFYPAWKGRFAAISAKTYEAAWCYDPDMPPAIRTITRYLAYSGDYSAPFDKRFDRPKEVS